jgi:hypothetical protein
MKTSFLKPGFEFIFSLSLIVILGLPPVLLAQTQKDLDIKIENGDTTVNGKNIKTMSAKDRQSALKDINHLNNETTINGDNSNSNQTVYVFKRRDTLGGKTGHFTIRMRKMENGDHQAMINGDVIIKDSLGNIVEDRHGMRRENFDERLRSPMLRFYRRNTQNFNYVNTDKDGISTHVSFRVSEASNDDLKRIQHVEGGQFEIQDLNLVPEFSTGKTLLMFNLPLKTVAEVKLHDSEGRLLWSDKAVNGSFSKTFSIVLNGIYYLQIKQGNKVSVKKIMKEE